jgi:hypothetical protein
MTHQMFLSIRERFVTLLETENNSYKYVRYYRLQINKFINEDEENDLLNHVQLSDARILHQLLYMMMSIYAEIGKTRYHSNDSIALILEKDINADIIKILKEAKYKDQKIVEINEIITRDIDETYFEIYKSQYGYRPSINADVVMEITNENVEQVYTNFHCVKRILEPTERLNEKHKEIEDYLFCLYYFNKTIIGVQS